MMGAGIIGAGALCLRPGASAIGSAAPGWLHAALHTVDNSRTKGTNISFTLETWILVPSACESTYTASANFVFVLASSGYAVALRANTTARVFWPLLFLTAAPPQRCVAGPLVLTDSTGAIGDGRACWHGTSLRARCRVRGFSRRAAGAAAASRT